MKSLGVQYFSINYHDQGERDFGEDTGDQQALFKWEAPIALSGLTEELRTSKEEILPALRELEQRELISFYSLAEAIKLTAKGSGLILKDNNSKAP